MSLRDGTKKMSKSDPSEYSRIMLNDSNDEIVQKIKKAKTDSSGLPDNINDANKRPEALNLLSMFAALNNKTTDEIIKEYQGKEFSVLKNDLSDVLVDKVEPIRKNISKLMNDKDYLDIIMKQGKESAITVADSV